MYEYPINKLNMILNDYIVKLKYIYDHYKLVLTLHGHLDNGISSKVYLY